MWTSRCSRSRRPAGGSRTHRSGAEHGRAALIPILVSLYLLARHRMYVRMLIGTAVVRAVVHSLPSWCPASGIASHDRATACHGRNRLAPAFRRAPPVAYVAGSMGTLIGADLLNLGQIARVGAPVVSIGGAGTFDGGFPDRHPRRPAGLTERRARTQVRPARLSRRASAATACPSRPAGLPQSGGSRTSVSMAVAPKAVDDENRACAYTRTNVDGRHSRRWKRHAISSSTPLVRPPCSRSCGAARLRKTAGAAPTGGRRRARRLSRAGPPGGPGLRTVRPAAGEDAVRNTPSNCAGAADRNDRRAPPAI